MNNDFLIFAINPGSTSTKIGIFKNEDALIVDNISHTVDDLKSYKNIMDQYFFRKKVIFKTLNEKQYPINRLDAVVGRGGLIRPVEGGTYIVDGYMLEDLRNTVYGEHASNLGAILAYEIGQEFNIPAFIVDPIVVDEMDEIAKITGLSTIKRRSVFHALNQKATARKVVKILGKRYEELNIIVAHLGGGITVGAHKKGRVIDVNNGLDGEGPFTPERAGALPVMEVVKLCLEDSYKADEIKRMTVGKGGLVSHLGTNDARVVRHMIDNQDVKASTIFEAMAYQVSKQIGACAAVLYGDVDAIVITGGLAHDEGFVGWIRQRVAFIADVYIFPGEDELQALAHGALMVLRNEEQAKIYGASHEIKIESEAVS
jgi:butyrate kinase